MQRLSALLALVACLACGGGTATAPDPTEPASIAGTYTLTAVNGAALPYSEKTLGGTQVWLSRVLTVGQDGTWGEVRRYAYPQVETVALSGTWAMDGPVVVFKSGGSTWYSGTATAPPLRLTDGSVTLTFAR